MKKLKGHIIENKLTIIQAFKLEDEINQKILRLSVYAKIKLIKNGKTKKNNKNERKKRKIIFKYVFYSCRSCIITRE
jgi:oligoendopeptidase F